jgi:hypothetical protein
VIISDSKTPADFRTEILQEIERRARPLRTQMSRAATQRTRDTAGAAYRELADFAAFLESIQFGEFPPHTPETA